MKTEIKNIFKIFVIFFIFLLFNKAYALLLSDIRIQLLKYEPFPAEPNKYVRIWLNVENAGVTSAKKLEIQLVPEYPFFLDESENSTRYYGEILPKENIILDYLVRVAPDAVEGKNNITIKYRTQENDIWNQKKISIYVQAAYPTISIDFVKLDPTRIEPGKRAILSLTLRNLGESDLRNIIARIDLKNLPIAISEDINEKIIRFMKGNESKVIYFNIMAHPDASCGVYTFPLYIKYQDYLGKEYQKEYLLTIMIGENPRLEVEIESSEVLRNNDVGKIEMSIINNGACEVKMLKAKIEDGDEFKILSPKKHFYIGTVSSNDYEIFDFRIWVKGNKEKIEIPIILEYVDGINNRYIERKSATLMLYSEEEISKIYSNNKVNMIFFVVIVALVFFIFYKIRKKK